MPYSSQQGKKKKECSKKYEFLILATIPLQAKLTACGSSVEGHEDTAAI